MRRGALWGAGSVSAGGAVLLLALATPRLVDSHGPSLAWCAGVGLGALGLLGAFASGRTAPVRHGVGVVTVPLAWCAPAIAGVGVAAARGSTELFGLCFGLAMAWWIAGSAGALRAMLLRHRSAEAHEPDFDHSPAHRCGACGYDLQGLPGGAVCPECGAPRMNP